VVDNPDVGLIIVGGGRTLTAPAGATGIQIEHGTVTASDIVVDGGKYGFDLQNDAVLSLTDATVSGAIDGNEGGFGIRSDPAHTGSLTLLRVRIDDNQNGVQVYGNLTVNDSTFLNNLYGLTTRGSGTITNSTFALNIVTALEVGSGNVTVTNTTITHTSLTGVSKVASSDGVVTFVDSMSDNSNGACASNLTAVDVIDGGGNFMFGNCGAIASYTGPIPPSGSWYMALPPLAQNPCAAGVSCTETVALPNGHPATGLGETCGLALDQRGEPRPGSDCDAGSFELPNIAPTATDDDFDDDPLVDVFEDDVATTLDVLANDNDPDGDDIVVISISNITAGAGIVTVDADGLGVTYTPGADFNGPMSFDYTMTDSFGGNATATASLTVGARNDPPTAVDDNLTAFKGTNGSQGTDVTQRVVENDLDVDGDTFTIDDVTDPVPAAAGTVFVTQDRESVIFRPSPTYVGNSTFTYTLIDSFGGPTGESAPATVFVTTTATNDDPIAEDDIFPGFTIDEDAGPTVLDVLANDSDPNGDPIEVISVTPPTSGGTAAVVNGELVFTAPDNFFGGTSLFDYTIGDGQGGTATASLTVSINSVNDLPVANDDVVSVNETSGFLRIRPLDNDTDVEPQTPFKVISVTQPSIGSAAVTNEFFVDFTFPRNVSGTTSFDYTMEDFHGGRDSATITVTINAVNDEPVLGVDGEVVFRNTSNNVVDVLDNDSDPNGDALTITAITQPANGTAAITGAGTTVSYTPDAGYLSPPQEPDVFTYSVSDGNGGSATSTINMFVVTDNNSPVANDDSIVVDTIPTKTLLVLANDSDADNDALTIASATQPFPVSAGSIRISNDKKSIEFASLQAFEGEATFSYVVSDGENSDSARVTLTAASGLACDPNYQPCIPVSSTDLNCSDIGITVQVVGEDIHGFDSDGDGVGCGSEPPPFNVCNGELVPAGDGCVPEPPPTPPVLRLMCNGKVVTIDLNTNGGNGNGTSGNDVILGTPGSDVISAGTGNDVICAGAGDDRVLGGPGDDTVFGGAGDDKLFGRQGNDEIFGGEGDDVIHGNIGNDVLHGEAGADRIFGYANDDTIFGGEGDDRLHGNFGFDVIDGGPGNDAVFGYGDEDTLNGGPGDDVESGNRGDDVVNGGSGNDEVWGADGNDEVNGGPGDDVVRGNSLNDTLTGGLGNDILDGGIDTDTCIGGPGVDTATRCETTTGVP